MTFKSDENEARQPEPRDSRDYREPTQRTRYNLDDDAPALGDSLNTDDVKRFVDITSKSVEANISKLSDKGRRKWTVLGVSGDEADFTLDSVLVIGQSTDGNEMTAVMTVLFTGGRKLPMQVVKERGRSAQYSTVPGDQYDNHFKANLNNLIARKAPEFALGTITHIGALPVVDDKVSDDRLMRIGNETINLVNAYLRNATEVGALTIADLDLEDRELVAGVQFHAGETIDAVTELPHRSDVAIQLELVRTDRGRSDGPVNVLAKKRDLPLAQILGHVDIYYMGPEKSQRRSAWGNKREDKIDTQIYGLNLIITKLQHNQTPAQMVLALAQIPVLQSESVLTTGLRPGGKNHDLRTYKALGYELDVDLAEIPEQLSDDEWLDMCGSVLREDGQMVSIQIPRNGVSTPMHNILTGACDYNLDESTRRRFAETLIDAAEELTGGRFVNRFKGDDIYNIGKLKSTPVLLGTWTDERGQTRDLREIGYYEILSHYGEKNRGEVEFWEECLFNDKIDISERLEKMEQIIDDFTGGAYKLIDRAENIELNVEGWLYNLTDACREAGMVVLAEGIQQDTSAYRRGYTSDYTTREYEGGAFRQRGRSGYGFGRGR